MPRKTAGPFPADGTNRRAGQSGDIYQSDQGRYAQSIRNLAGIPLSRDSIFCDNSAAELAQQTVEISSGVESLAGRATVPISL